MNITITLDTATKVSKYIKWHVGKSGNVPDMKERLRHCTKILEEYKDSSTGYPKVLVTLS